MSTIVASNHKGYRDYNVLETFEFGIELKGGEVKSIRQAKVTLNDSFARVEDGQLFLYNTHISPYAEAKLKAHEEFIKGYREKNGVFACSGILFNHESPRRGKQFVTRKITDSLAKVAHGLQGHFDLGNLNAKRDWGFAGDYVKAMHLMLQQDTPEDFVIATGETHSVRDFVNAAAKGIGMDIAWSGKDIDEVGTDTTSGKVVVRVSEAFYRPREVDFLQGDASKALAKLGWKPTTDFDTLVAMMSKADFAVYENTPRNTAVSA